MTHNPRTLPYTSEAKFFDAKSEEALGLASEAATIYRAINHRFGLTCALSNSAAYLVTLGGFSAVRTHAREALSIERGSEAFAGTIAVQHLAAIAALRRGVIGSDRRESQERAARLLGFVDARYSELQLVASIPNSRVRLDARGVARRAGHRRRYETDG